MSSTHGGDRAVASAVVEAARACAPGRSGVRTAVVWEALLAVLKARAGQAGGARLDILDAGGGTGGFAVPLAALGHHVTVIDPSPDSLAAAQRRAAEAGVELRAVQGDLADLPALAGESAADLVLCHSVLEYVDDPRSAVATIARVLRPGGTVSVLAAGAVAAAIHRARSGNFDEARQLIGATVRPGAQGPPRWFTLSSLITLIEGAGMRPGAAHGVRIFSDLVPGSLVDGDLGAGVALLALEEAAAQHPALRDIATQLHILGHRADGPGAGRRTGAETG